jgi:hypothetical protein
VPLGRRRERCGHPDWGRQVPTATPASGLRDVGLEGVGGKVRRCCIAGVSKPRSGVLGRLNRQSAGLGKSSCHFCWGSRRCQLVGEVVGALGRGRYVGEVIGVIFAGEVTNAGLLGKLPLLVG